MDPKKLTFLLRLILAASVAVFSINIIIRIVTASLPDDFSIYYLAVKEFLR